MMCRWKDHYYDAKIGLKRLLQNALRKHGDVDWDHEILDVVQTLESTNGKFVWRYVDQEKNEKSSDHRRDGARWQLSC